LNGHYVRALVIAAGVAILAACSGGSTNSTLPMGTTGGTAGAMALGNGTVNAQQVCSAVNLRPGYARCFSWIRTDIHRSAKPDAGAYGPSDLQTAYALPSSTNGTGQTVGIVDAFGYPNAESDLGSYRSHYGEAACTTANGCFKKVNQTGGTSYPPTNSNWDGEQALDVDMVSAICPNCHIVLVEATDNSFKNLAIAEKQAFTQGAGQTSNSYGGDEFAAKNASYKHAHTVVVASSGDEGYGAQQPCSFSTVVCVGGTTLSKTAPRTESGWTGAGSGCSALVLKPSYQTDTGCKMRSESDVSAVANPVFPVAVFLNGGFTAFGGTSVASPIIASVFALAGNHSNHTNAKSIWQGASHLNDITTGGTNGSCPPAYPYICQPGVGYDGVTGMGSPNGVGAF
jgi:subtilase family serine protease